MNVEVRSLYTYFVESYYKWMLNFVKSFFCIYWDDHMISILHIFNMVYHIDWSADVEPPFIPGINPTWSWCILLMYWWILFANILLRFFCIYVHWGYWRVIFFLCGILVWFWYQGNACLIKCVWKSSPIFCFLEEFEKNRW